MANLQISNRLFSFIKEKEIISLDIDNEKKDFSFHLSDLTYLREHNNIVTLLVVNEGKLNYYDIVNNKITSGIEGKQVITDDGKWKKEGRQEVKLSKLLKLLNNKKYFALYDVDDVIFTKAFNKFIEVKSVKIKGLTGVFDFKFSTEISKIYDLPTGNSCGLLGDSCMRSNSSHDCKEYAEIYDYVPGLQIIYKVNSDNELTCRALLWECVIWGTETKIKFIDRIYGNEINTQMLIQYAKDNNYAYRMPETDNKKIYYKDEVINVFVKINYDFIKYGENNGTAYFDTIFHLNKDDLLLSDKDLNDIELQNCDGTAMNISRCSCCGKIIDDESSYTYDETYYCESCFDDKFFICERCEEIHPKDEAVHYNGTYYCESCLDRMSVYQCDNCGDYTDDYYQADGELYCLHCLERLGYAYCEECGEYKNDTISADDRICSDCATVRKEKEANNER